MPFTVVWEPAALDSLAELWLQAVDKQAVADAADRIDRWLRLKPEEMGRQRQGYRVFAEEPLVVGFEVSPEDCLVRVVWVHRQ
jgi:plasmid stabilization system protein ParE